MVVIRAALIALAYIGLIAAMIAVMAIHYDVTLKLVAIVMTAAGIVGFIVFVDMTRQQQRRKWRDHPGRRAGMFKDWNK